ncbi:MAG: VWA domain-containing protein [Bacteroidota bacterium]|nr:VWA domain-containing protein [Bacteroidota bacterium]
MDLEEVKYLYILAILPVLLLIYWLYAIWKKNKQKQFAEKSLLNRLAPEQSPRKNMLKFVILVFVILFLVISLVNPRIGTKTKTVDTEGVDVVFAIDVSKSMLVRDVAPNRLDKAKQIVYQIMNQLQSDRIGLIVYAGSAAPLLPMTSDYGMAKMILSNTDTNMLSSQGTAIAQAIELGVKYFDDDQANKLLVLLSDGEDHQEGFDLALEQANQINLKILSVGLGTEDGDKIPSEGAFGYIRDRDNNLVISKLNSEVLQDIAKATNGEYVLGNNTAEVIQKFSKVVNDLEKSRFQNQEIAEYDSKFQWFIFVAILLLIFDFFVFERKTRWIKILNLFNEKDK